MIALLACLGVSAALAGRFDVEVANDELRDGVHGLLVRTDPDEASALRRRGLSLDPADHRVYLVLRDEWGRVVHHGRRAIGAGPGVNDSTTTPALPADDGPHAFFLPYHRLLLEPGEHDLDIEVELDAGLAEGPIRLTSSKARVRMPALDWVFLAIEQGPPNPNEARSCPREIRWRARVGRDVLALRSRTPAVVVVPDGDPVELEAQVCPDPLYYPVDGGVLGAAARRAGLLVSQVRALQVRKAPPRLVDGAASLTARTRGGQPGWELELSWTLDGRGVDALIPVEVRTFVAGPDGRRWPLPARTLAEGPDRARLFVPGWGLPDVAAAGRRVRVGWELIASDDGGSPLVREHGLGRLERTLALDETVAPSVLRVRTTSATVVDDRGLVALVTLRWTLPEGLERPWDGPATQLRVAWAGRSLDAASTGAWTPCARDGAPLDCADAWGIGPITTSDGMSRVALPLATRDVGGGGPPELVVSADIEGYRGARATLPLDLPLPAVHEVLLRPRRGRIACEPGESARLVWTAPGGLLLHATRAVPCDRPATWTRADAVVLRAYAGDTLHLGVEVGARTLRRVPVKVGPGELRPPLAEPTAGIDKLVVDVLIR